jgi:glycosyltransferase involved in cell wall biosynthesis
LSARMRSSGIKGKRMVVHDQTGSSHKSKIAGANPCYNEEKFVGDVVMVVQNQAGSSHERKIVAAIPCYDEEKFVGDLVRKTKGYVHEVVVIDDGSKDGTVQAAQAAGAIVVSHGAQKGYGSAICSCFKAAKDRNADILAILDGDGQHNPDELPSVIDPIRKGEANMVIGSRFLDGRNHVPAYRKFGIKVITGLFNLGSSTKVTDSQSGFRAYDRNIIDGIQVKETGMSASIEVLAKVRRSGLVVHEVPITCKYHSSSSTLNPVAHGLAVAFDVLRLRLWRRGSLESNQKEGARPQ